MKEKHLWTVLFLLAALLCAGWGLKVRADQARNAPPPLPLGKKGPILDDNGLELHPTNTPNTVESKHLPFSQHPWPTPVTVIDLAPGQSGSRYEVIILSKDDKVKIVFKVPVSVDKEDAVKRISGEYYFPEKGETYYIADPFQSATPAALDNAP